MDKRIEAITAVQKRKAQPPTGKGFLLAVAGVIARLAIAQIAVNLLIVLTGVGLINVAFYVYAVVLMVRFMQRVVAGTVYTLKEETLVLQKMLGDSTTSVIEIPLSAIRSIRPVAAAERLHLYYRQVTAIDPQARSPFRVRAAFAASLLSARLARLLAGRQAEVIIGHAIVFEEGGVLRCCVFCPDEAFCDALREALPQACGLDDRAQRGEKTTLWARALQRAFPALYPYVRPLVDEDALQQAREATARKPREKKADPGPGDEAAGADRRKRRRRKA